MTKLNSYVIALLALFFQSCNHSTNSKLSEKQIPVAVSADSIIAKFQNTPFRKAKLMQGASGYVDTTFRSEIFVVTDTISEIQVNNAGEDYIILGRTKNYKNLQCFFTDKKAVDSLKLGQVITLSSNRHSAKALNFEMDTTIKILDVRMADCKLIK